MSISQSILPSFS
ncbi:hypothetical protein E2C01_049445 [Portunus trituberculatus]|uniref:Uncharacterized protein n=1 Tax=Portunus trituberculatus TaxID=210409 RepID=A0A5B7GDW8_PORTR|nr:hypothetical protein [Portunus trituberculatus]